MGRMKATMPCPSPRENPMTENRSNAKSPMRTRPKEMTVHVKVKGKGR